VGALVTQLLPTLAATATAPDLGTATSFAVLAGQAVTDSSPASVISGDLGVYPGTTGPSGTGNPAVSNGSIHDKDALAMGAQADLTKAYTNTAGETPCTDETGKVLGQDIGTVSTPLLPGIYCFSSSAQITGALHLSGDGVFVFQVKSGLTTAPNSSVVLDSNATACKVFWQVGSSATLDTTTVFAGTLMAYASISLNKGVSVDGRILARTGSVTLIDDRIIRPTCAAASGGSSPSPGLSPGPGAGTTPSGSTPGSPGPSIGDSPGPGLPDAGTGRPSSPRGQALAVLGSICLLLITALAASRRTRPVP